MAEYFPREVLHMRIQTPFEAASAEGRCDVTAKIHGGGVAGQADALRHGIARALEKIDESLRAPLKRGGLPHARCAQEGAQEVRAEGRPRALPVLEALGAVRLPIAPQVRCCERRRDAERRFGLPLAFD